MILASLTAQTKSSELELAMVHDLEFSKLSPGPTSVNAAILLPGERETLGKQADFGS